MWRSIRWKKSLNAMSPTTEKILYCYFVSTSMSKRFKFNACQRLRVKQRSRGVFIASYGDTTNWELTSWEPMSRCLTALCLALCSLKYVWSNMRFSKWLSDRFNPLGEFSPMRGERGPFDNGVQLTEKHSFISFVIKSKLQRYEAAGIGSKHFKKRSNAAGAII